jgi:hypothetical protein
MPYSKEEDTNIPETDHSLLYIRGTRGKWVDLERRIIRHMEIFVGHLTTGKHSILSSKIQKATSTEGRVRVKVEK